MGISLFYNRLIFTPFNMSLSSSEILLSLVDNHSIYTPCHMSLSLSEILHVRCKTLIQYQIRLTVQPAHLYPRVLPPSYFFL